jgi:Skp family chaperone for outer membrane proteins
MKTNKGPKYNFRKQLDKVSNSISGNVIKEKKYELVLDVQMNINFNRNIDI